MKLSAFILASLFVLVLALLHLQPLLGNSGFKDKEGQSCASSCQKKSACNNKDESSDEEKGCPIQACNPFVPCAMSSCCYIIENFFPGINDLPVPKITQFVFDDNRLLNQSSDCWHPPEFRS